MKWSLRTRVTAAAAVAVAAAVLALSSALLLTDPARDADDLDRVLQLTARRLAHSLGRGTPADLVVTAPLFGAQLDVKVLEGERTITASQYGERPAPGATGLGLTTVTDGEDWRVATQQLADGRRVQVAAPVADASRVLWGRRTRVFVLSLAVGAVAIVLTWWLVGLALAPLERLRRTARTVAATSDLSRRTGFGDGPTEIRALAADVDAMLDRLEQAAGARDEALATSRQFAADAGHELRTPLTSISTNLDTLARNPGLDADDRAALLTDIKTEQARLLNVLDGLEALATGDSRVAPEQLVDLADIVADAAAVARRRRGAAIDLDVPKGSVLVRGWDDGLRLIADNLIDNAVHHGADGGYVWVTVATGDAITLVVSDDGPGIRPDERARVLERFVRGTDATATGSGLGLAIVAQQVRLHGATLSIDDAPAGGARVTVAFPRPPASAQRGIDDDNDSISSSSRSS